MKNLLITKPTGKQVSSFFEIFQDNSVVKLEFPNYQEHDLMQPVSTFKFKLPWEIVTEILIHLFKISIRTFNADYASTLFTINRDFLNRAYNMIYPKCNISTGEKYRRLHRTMDILAMIHDNYTTVGNNSFGDNIYSILKLVSKRPPFGIFPEPWDFNFDTMLEPIYGAVVDPGTSFERRYVGASIGDTVMVIGQWDRGVMYCQKMQTPIINLKFVDIHDTLKLTEFNIRLHFRRFFGLLKYMYGKNCAINVMIQSGIDENPFVTDSTIYMTF